jgi:hypothetical protein
MIISLKTEMGLWQIKTIINVSTALHNRYGVTFPMRAEVIRKQSIFLN